MLPLLAGCDGISIAPSCPNTLRVGETGQVFGQVVDPGAIPVYLWEVIPETAGVFGNAAAPDTTFQAQEEGVAIIRLTASDGLYQVISECEISVSGFVGLAVSLEAEPISAEVGEPVRLTCESIGATPAGTLSITQTEGPILDLVDAAPGVVRFQADRADAYVFRCVGTVAEGQTSEPAFVTVNIFPAEQPPDDNANDNVNDNGNGGGNANGNANTNDNTS